MERYVAPTRLSRDVSWVRQVLDALAACRARARRPEALQLAAFLLMAMDEMDEAAVERHVALLWRLARCAPGLGDENAGLAADLLSWAARRLAARETADEADHSPGAGSHDGEMLLGALDAALDADPSDYARHATSLLMERRCHRAARLGTGVGSTASEAHFRLEEVDAALSEQAGCADDLVGTPHDHRQANLRMERRLLLRLGARAPSTVQQQRPRRDP